MVLVAMSFLNGTSMACTLYAEFVNPRCLAKCVYITMRISGIGLIIDISHLKPASKSTGSNSEVGIVSLPILVDSNDSTISGTKGITDLPCSHDAILESLSV